MNYEQFCWWFKGFVENRNEGELPTQEQWESIVEHLNLIFKKETTQKFDTIIKPDEGKTDNDKLIEELMERWRERNPFPSPYCPPVYPSYPKPDWLNPPIITC